MKRFAYIVSILLICILMVAYMLSLLVRNGEVQTAAVRWLAAEVSQALKADIDVGHVDYRFFNTLHIDDIYVSDQQGDTLAYVGTVDVQVRMRDLLRRKVSVRKVAIDRPYVNLHDHNYDFLVRALQSNDTTSLDSLPVAIEVNDVHITNIRARMDTLLLTDAEARMSLNRLDNEALEADIQTLHGKIVCQGRPCPLWIPPPRNRPVSLDASHPEKKQHESRNAHSAFSLPKRTPSPLKTSANEIKVSLKSSS